MVYSEKWAYVPIGPDEETELYRLEDDPYAEKNVADANPEIVEEMHGQLVAWFEEIGAPAEAIEVYT